MCLSTTCELFNYQNWLARGLIWLSKIVECNCFDWFWNLLKNQSEPISDICFKCDALKLVSSPLMGLAMDMYTWVVHVVKQNQHSHLIPFLSECILKSSVLAAVKESYGLFLCIALVPELLCSEIQGKLPESEDSCRVEESLRAGCLGHLITINVPFFGSIPMPDTTPHIFMRRQQEMRVLLTSSLALTQHTHTLILFWGRRGRAHPVRQTLKTVVLCCWGFVSRPFEIQAGASVFTWGSAR